MNNLFDKDFFNMTTVFAVIVVSVLAVISYLGSRLPDHQTAAPAASAVIFASSTRAQ